VAEDEEKKIKAKERLAKKRQRDKKIFVTVVVVIVLFIALVAIGYVVSTTVLGSDDDDDDVTQTDKYVDVPVSTFDDDRDIHWYTYESENEVEIKYLIVNRSDGKLVAAFNHCPNTTGKNPGDPSCWELHLGFDQAGYYISCINKRCTYPINLIGSGVKSCCVPPSLNFTVVDGNVRIKIADLEAKEWYYITDGPSETRSHGH
jgi:uncharacterized membrane protein